MSSTHPSQPPDDSRGLSRRAFIVGALATGVVAACGSGDPDDTGSGDAGDPVSTAGDTAETDTFSVIQRFPQGMQTPGTQRLPMSLSTGGAALVQDGPDTLGARVVDLDGNEAAPPIVAVRRDVAPAPYYDFRPAVTDVGFFALLVDGGPADGASFQVSAPEDVPVPTPGEALAPFDTPTVDDPRGVDPICTRQPDACPFHDVTLAEAMEQAARERRVVAYCVGTPAFCQTGSCAPALEAMIDLQEEFADSVTFVHAEVYVDDTATTVTPAVEAAGLTYEPVLFVTDPDGTVLDRLDAVWNIDELRETLTRAVEASGL
jgi:hypothetical protein